MLLYGSTVSSPQYLRDLNGRPGVFFLFPDVGVQREGRYTLRIRLLRLSRYVYLCSSLIGFRSASSRGDGDATFKRARLTHVRLQVRSNAPHERRRAFTVTIHRANQHGTVCRSSAIAVYSAGYVGRAHFESPQSRANKTPQSKRG